MDLDFRFDFQRVGQGLFYTGAINGFNMVYDCGSDYTKCLRGAVGQYKRTLHSNLIDMVVLSHLHNDHVNGLDLLLKDVAVEDVFMPYLVPMERLLLAVRRKNLPDWYYVFLASPVSYLLERGVKRVTVIGGEKGEKGPPPHEIPPGPSDKPRGEISIDIPDDKELEAIIRTNDPELAALIGKELLVRNHQGLVIIPGLWLFRFFNYKVEEEKLNQFAACLNQAGVSPTHPKSIKSAIKDPPTIKKIRKCYEREMCKDLNDTSLAAYHGPVGDNRSVFCVHCEEGLRFPSCKHFYPSAIPAKCYYSRFDCMGQLLTGDIGLNNNQKYKEFITHYTHYLDTVSISQLSHHGSRTSWNEHILRALGECSHWVSSSGRPSFYGHPHSMVALDILRDYRCFCWSNQHNKFFIEGKVIW
ncbi:MAG: hypothetical protein HXS46_07540 [Theionarchaea archaeon]|nr:hypothetical protein [Theionarchaea archaeon]